MRRLGARFGVAVGSGDGRRTCAPNLALSPQPAATLPSLQLAMESLVFPRRLSPAPSAVAALADGLKSPKPLMKKQAVKRHHHKHNLRHRYEFLETLGKGTYGKVKKARESSGRLVSAAPSRGRRPAGRAAGGRAGGGECEVGPGTNALLPGVAPFRLYQAGVAWGCGGRWWCPLQI